MATSKKPKPPSFAAYKAQYGDEWKDAFKKGAQVQKSANQALKKAKKGTAAWAAAKEAFEAAKLAIPHKKHKKSGLSKAISQAGKVYVPIATAMASALTGGLAGIAAGAVKSGFMGGGQALAAGGENGEDESMSGGFFDDLLGGLNKAGQYANQGKAALEQIGGAFGKKKKQQPQAEEDDGGPGGGSFLPDAAAPAAAAQSTGMKQYLPWIIGGGVVLVLLVVLMRKR